MKKSQLEKLMKTILDREVSTNGWEEFELVPAPNQEELRIPEHPTWNCNEKGFYKFHIVLNTTRDAYTNKAGRVKLQASERWAYFIVSYDMEGTSIKKTHTVEIIGNTIYIETKVQANNHYLGSFNMEVDMLTHNWENRFSHYVTYGRS